MMVFVAEALGLTADADNHGSVGKPTRGHDPMQLLSRKHFGCPKPVDSTGAMVFVAEALGLTADADNHGFGSNVTPRTNAAAMGCGCTKVDPVGERSEGDCIFRPWWRAERVQPETARSFHSMDGQPGIAHGPPVASTHRQYVSRLEHFLKRTEANEARLQSAVKRHRVKCYSS
ncbi:unnamed protein product [Effrenium voratum]|nr:unnamed protein product [Effrenium voratum]